MYFVIGRKSLIDLGSVIDWFSPVIINFAPLSRVIPLSALEQKDKSSLICRLAGVTSRLNKRLYDDPGEETGPLVGTR